MSLPEEPPKITPEQWQLGMEFFQKYLKKIKIKREGKVVHVDWIFEFPNEEMARSFALSARLQLGGGAQEEEQEQKQ